MDEHCARPGQTDDKNVSNANGSKCTIKSVKPNDGGICTIS